MGDDDCHCYMDWPEDPQHREELRAGGALIGAALGGAFLIGVGATIAYAALAGGFGR